MENYLLLDAQTIVQDKKDISRYVSESIMNIYGIITEVDLKNYLDLTSKETAIKVLKENGLTEQEIGPRLDRYLEDLPYSYYNVAWSDKLELSEGSKQFIEFVKKSKLNLGFVSLEPTKVAEMRFKKLGIEGYFSFKFGSENGVTPKNILKEASSIVNTELQFAPEQGILMSSSPRLIDAANDLGIYTVAIAKTPEARQNLSSVNPREIIPSLKERPKKLRTL